MFVPLGALCECTVHTGLGQLSMSSSCPVYLSGHLLWGGMRGHWSVTDKCEAECASLSINRVLWALQTHACKSSWQLTPATTCGLKEAVIHWYQKDLGCVIVTWRAKQRFVKGSPQYVSLSQWGKHAIKVLVVKKHKILNYATKPLTHIRSWHQNSYAFITCFHHPLSLFHS